MPEARATWSFKDFFKTATDAYNQFEDAASQGDAQLALQHDMRLRQVQKLGQAFGFMQNIQEWDSQFKQTKSQEGRDLLKPFDDSLRKKLAQQGGINLVELRKTFSLEGIDARVGDYVSEGALKQLKAGIHNPREADTQGLAMASIYSRRAANTPFMELDAVGEVVAGYAQEWNDLEDHYLGGADDTPPQAKLRDQDRRRALRHLEDISKDKNITPGEWRLQANELRTVLDGFGELEAFKGRLGSVGDAFARVKKRGDRGMASLNLIMQGVNTKLYETNALQGITPDNLVAVAEALASDKVAWKEIDDYLANLKNADPDQVRNDPFIQGIVLRTAGGAMARAMGGVNPAPDITMRAVETAAHNASALAGVDPKTTSPEAIVANVAYLFQTGPLGRAAVEQMVGPEKATAFMQAAKEVDERLLTPEEVNMFKLALGDVEGMSREEVATGINNLHYQLLQSSDIQPGTAAYEAVRTSLQNTYAALMSETWKAQQAGVRPPQGVWNYERDALIKNELQAMPPETNETVRKRREAQLKKMAGDALGRFRNTTVDVLKGVTFDMADMNEQAREAALAGDWAKAHKLDSAWFVKTLDYPTGNQNTPVRVNFGRVLQQGAVGELLFYEGLGVTSLAADKEWQAAKRRANSKRRESREEESGEEESYKFPVEFLREGLRISVKAGGPGGDAIENRRNYHRLADYVIDRLERADLLTPVLSDDKQSMGVKVGADTLPSEQAGIGTKTFDAGSQTQTLIQELIRSSEETLGFQAVPGVRAGRTLMGRTRADLRGALETDAKRKEGLATMLSLMPGDTEAEKATKFIAGSVGYARDMNKAGESVSAYWEAKKTPAQRIADERRAEAQRREQEKAREQFDYVTPRPVAAPLRKDVQNRLEIHLEKVRNEGGMKEAEVLTELISRVKAGQPVSGAALKPYIKDDKFLTFAFIN